MENLGNKYFKMANNTKGRDSAPLYIKAGIEYSISNENYKAALSFQFGAEELLSNNLKHQAALNYIKASTHYDGIDNSKAISTLTTALKLLNNSKNNKLIAINLEALALLNHKGNQFLEAIKSYERASKNYTSINMSREALRCKHNISTIMIENEEYEKAIIHLEKIEYKNKNIFFDIGILRLYINDTTACTEYLMRQTKFMLTREYFLLNDLIIAVDVKNKSKFRKLLIDHNAIFPFQKWQFNLLIIILERI